MEFQVGDYDAQISGLLSLHVIHLFASELDVWLLPG
jgi:hypothetical protein